MSIKKASIGKDLLGIAGKISDVKNNKKDISELIKNIDNVKDIGKVLKIADVSKDTVEATLDLLDMGDAISDVTNAMDAFADSQKGIKGIGEAFKGLGNEILGFVKSNWATIAVLGTIGVAIGLAYRQITKFSRSVEKAKESQSNYSSTISELQSLESEIDTTSSKIDELNSKGTLTLVEKSELQNLKLQNAELERQRDIKQKIADTQSRESINDAMESLNMAKTTDLTQKTMQQQLLESDNWIDRVAAGQIANSGIQNMVYEQTDIVTATQNEVKALNDLKEAREKLYLERDNESITKKRKESIDSEISALEDEIDRYDSEVVKNMETLQELRNNFIEESTQLPRSNLTTKELQKYNSITDIIDEYVNNDPLAKQAEALSEIWKDDSFAQAQQKLVDTFRTGKDLSIDEITNQFPDLVSACNDAGISVSTLREELIALASQDSGATKLEEDFMSFQNQLVTAINGIDTVNASLANSFSGKGLSVEFDEETGAIVGDIANIKAAYQGLEGYDASVLFEKTANGIHINRQALRELQTQQESLQKATNLEKIAELQERLNQAMTDAKSKAGTEDYASSQLLVNDLKNQLEIAQELAAAYDGATSAYQKWINAQSNGEEGDMFRTVSETMRERGNELYSEGRYNTEEFRAIADYYSNQDLSNASIDQLVQAFEHGKTVMDNFFTGGKEGIDNFMSSIKQISDEQGLNWIEELNDGSIKFNANSKDIADALQISQEAVEALFRAASEYTDIVLANDSGTEELNQRLEEATQKANEAKQSLKELQDEGQISTDIEIDVDVSKLDKAGIEERIASLEGLKENAEIKFGADSSEVEYVNQLLEEAELRKEQLEHETSVGIELDINGDADLDALGEKLRSLPKDETSNVSINISNESSLDGVVEQIKQIPAQTPVTLSFTVQNQEQADALKSKLDELSSEDGKSINYTVNVTDNTNGTLDETKSVNVTYNKNSEEVDSYQPEDKKATVKFNKDSSIPDNYQPKDKYASVIYRANTASLPTTFSPITRYVNYVKTGDTDSKGKAYGTFTSPAHADGTAYNVINRIPAHADGNISLKKDERALVNELGTEGLIRDGKLSWIPGGMHFQNFKKGDIILSAAQMQSLFKTGKASGTGKAYADGTLTARQMALTDLNAYAKGSWTFGNTGNGNLGGSGYTPTYSPAASSSTSQVASNTAKIAENTADAAESAEEFEETIDWIETVIDRIERNIKNIERIAGSAYNTFEKRNNALRDQISSITDEISIQQQAYERYLQEANTVGLSDDYRRQVENGTIDISTITDKELSENINKYKEW